MISCIFRKASQDNNTLLRYTEPPFFVAVLAALLMLVFCLGYSQASLANNPNFKVTHTVDEVNRTITFSWGPLDSSYSGYQIRAEVYTWKGVSSSTEDDGLVVYEEEWDENIIHDELALSRNTNSMTFDISEQSQNWSFGVAPVIGNNRPKFVYGPAVILRPKAVPVAPQDLRYDLVSSNSRVRFLWTPTPYTAHYEFEGYAGGKLDHYRNLSNRSDSYHAGALGTGWVGRLRSCNLLGCSDWVSVETAGSNFLLPAGVLDLSYHLVNNRISGKILGHSGASSYEVNESLDGGATWSDNILESPRTKSFYRRDVDLKKFRYSYRGRMCAPGLCGPYSDIETVGSESVQLITTVAYSVNDAGVRVTWSKHPIASKYYLSRSIDNGKNWDDNYYSGSNTSFVDKAIGTHSAIYYRVRACSTTCTAWSSTPAGN